MLIVYQMSKVASQTWMQAAKDAMPGDAARVLHCHFMVPSQRERMIAALMGPGVRQNMSNMLIANDILRKGAAAWTATLAARQANDTVKIISGIRDPVARSISAIIFLADFVGHAERPLNPRTPLRAQDVIEILRENWRDILARSEPQGTFEWLLWCLNGAYRSWFADELGAVFGVDVLGEPFERERASKRIRVPGADVFIYRVEDMQPAAPGYPALLAQSGAFLGSPLAAFPAVNTSSTRRSREITDAVRRDFSLPAAQLDAIYDDSVIRHFYSLEEIDALKKRWRSR
jgi:hypothetical protein